LVNRERGVKVTQRNQTDPPMCPKESETKLLRKEELFENAYAAEPTGHAHSAEKKKRGKSCGRLVQQGNDLASPSTANRARKGSKTHKEELRTPSGERESGRKESRVGHGKI